MSDQAVTTSELAASVAKAVGAVQDAHAQLVEGIHTLATHDNDPTAHGIDSPDSVFYQAVAGVARDAAEGIVDGDALGSLVSTKVGDAIDQQLPTVLKAELHNPQSLINQSIGSCVESVIDDKIKNGELSGGGSGSGSQGGNQGGSSDPENPDEPDKPVIDPENPDDANFWDQIADPTDTGGLTEGDLYPAPAISVKDYWLKGAIVGISITPDADMSVPPAKYELYFEGAEDLVEVTVNSEGTGIYNGQLPEDMECPAKRMIAAVAIDQYGNRSAMARRIIRVVNEDYVLLPEFVVPEADGEAFDNGMAIWKLRPFRTLCENEAELHTNSRYRIVNSQGQTLFDSYAVSDTAQLELYATETPGVAMTPDTEYFMEAQFQGITLGWSGWARRTVKVSRVATPEITSPASGTEITWPKGISVSISEFALATGGLDIHSSTDWLLSRDRERQNVVKLDAASRDLTAHIIIPDDLADGETCYLSARVHAQASGPSAWSLPVPIVAEDGFVKQPTVTAPAFGATIVFNDTGIAISTSPFAADGFNDEHIETDYKICSDVNGTSAVLQALASADLLAHTFTAAQCASLADGATLYIFVRHRGRRLGWSQWSQALPVKMKKGIVNTPSIASPAANATVVALNNSLTVTSTAFGVNTSTDDHTKTDWKLCSDAAGNSVIAQALNSADKTSHVFSGLTLPAGITTVYLFVRHQGQKFGESAWSQALPINLSNAITTAGGRKYYRHPSNMGGVIVANILGQTTHLFVADAAYRTKAAWDSRTSYVDISGLTNYTGIPTTRFNGGSANITTADAKTITDEQLNALFTGSGKHDANTAKANTDILAAIGTCAAALHCRSVQVDGRGCDLANIQQMALVYCEAETFDAYDSTVASYPANKLSGWNIAGVGLAWSSTEFNNGCAWSVNSGGYCYGNYKSNAYAVVPVQEIAA